ncbi:MAG TPA: DUF1080 domain-containing protein [Isosphaeraceae bacterium]|jgi:hypothetical protein|nr:DUF1080 domain-containing protein [Isosphaeraceae bacterium]
MRGRILALIPLVLAPTPARDDVPPFAKETPEVKSGGPVFRFNGRDLAGFYTYLNEHKYDDPKGVFTVRDGLLRISGEEWGGIATKEAYRDYHLIVEWKWGEATWGSRAKAARDSGILVHGVGADGAAGGQWLESIECQVIEGGTGDFILVGGKGKPSLTCEARRGPDGQPYYEKGAEAVARDSGRINWWGRDPSWKDVLGFRGRRDVEQPAGRWNRMEVICDGGSITTLLNGLVVNAGTHARPAAGKVMIQSEGAEVFVRTFEIRPLAR